AMTPDPALARDCLDLAGKRGRVHIEILGKLLLGCLARTVQREQDTPARHGVTGMRFECGQHGAVAAAQLLYGPELRKFIHRMPPVGAGAPHRRCVISAPAAIDTPRTAQLW